MFEYIHSVFNIISVMLIKETLDKFYQTINTGFKVIKGKNLIVIHWSQLHNVYTITTTCSSEVCIWTIQFHWFSALILMLLGWILNIDSMNTENKSFLCYRTRSNAGVLNLSDVNLLKKFSTNANRYSVEILDITISEKSLVIATYVTHTFICNWSYTFTTNSIINAVSHHQL